MKIKEIIRTYWEEASARLNLWPGSTAPKERYQAPRSCRRGGLAGLGPEGLGAASLDPGTFHLGGLQASIGFHRFS